MKKLVILFIIVLSLGLLVGCHTPRTRLLSVQNSIYGTPTLDSIERSIVKGAANAGWAVETEPGVVHAYFIFSSRPITMNEPKLRNPALPQEGYEGPDPALPNCERNTENYEPFYTSNRMLYVTISYNAYNYRIEYADSKNMGFDDESDSIGKVYPQLVKKLDRAIQAELVQAY